MWGQPLLSPCHGEVYEMRVLIVDDNVIYLQQMKKYLCLSDLSVDIADGGELALAMMSKDHYDVVILDLKMPDLSGIEVLQRACQQGIQSNFIVITGYGSVETAVDAMKLGAADYLQKPFEPEKLPHLIKKVGSTESIPIDSFSSGNLKDWLKRICSGKSIFLITDLNPKEFEEEYGISSTRRVWLTEESHENAIDARKIATLRNLIEEFTTKNQNALIIHGGVSNLLGIHGWDKLRDYLSCIHNMAKEKKFQLIVLYQSPIEKELLQTLKGMPLPSFINEVVEVFNHDTHRHILQLLDTHKALHYTDFLKEMDIDLSSALAFHLKKLLRCGIINKKGDQYMLTLRGRYFVDILNSLITGKYRDPASNIIYYPIPR